MPHFNTPSLFQFLSQLKKKVEANLELFKQGNMLALADDGKRENEVDLIFHARFSSETLVNFALSHGKGLLCVALGPKEADRLGLASAPRYPVAMSHTNFLLPIDAKNHITSGISASDRAYTIKLLALEDSTYQDFITPGHVFPVVAVKDGMLARSGHTEACIEIAKLCNMNECVAMCEVLGAHGPTIHTSDFLDHTKNPTSPFYNLPILSTIDLFWYKLIFSRLTPVCDWVQTENGSYMSSLCDFIFPIKINFKNDFDTLKIRVVLGTGQNVYDNKVSKEDANVEITMLSFDEVKDDYDHLDFQSIVNLSLKDGVKLLHPSLKRILSYLYAFDFLSLLANQDIKMTMDSVCLLTEKDTTLLKEILKM
jgi:3,4-dihydroxy-2-butanone 4-phosphate synthase